MPQAKIYSKEEFRQIIKLVSENTPIEEIAKVLNRTPKGVEQQINHLKRQGLLPKGRKTKSEIFEELKADIKS